ncbi:HIRAN domain-containing protein [Caulobacter sp. Root655]|uniref:HIRAN domain-containing protein n=1 Tax=Caulobacter sp. Root655 TaxID=1736578 RepID=UPI0012E3E81D|nr:HIRAN domain-containing protein [Caulobacter sp. Root655]
MNWLAKLFGGISGREPEAKPSAVQQKAPSQNVRKLRVVGKGGYPRDAVGESNYQEALSRVCGGHNRHGHELTTTGVLMPEPTNPYDPNAIMVTIGGERVGYLARDEAKRYGDALVAAGFGGQSATVDVKVVGGWRTNQHDEGHFGVKLALPWPVKFEH